MIKRAAILITALLCCTYVCCAQKVAVKTNILYDVTSTVNAGVELGLAPRWTIDISGNYNAWTIKEDTRWKHWMIQPELRLWFCDRFSGHFMGAHALAGQYNFGGIQNNLKFLNTDFSPLSSYRFQGWAAGAGIAYGYAWILNRHLNLEAEIGVGYIYTQYDKFNCVGCGKRVLTGQPYHYVGPTKAAISIVYVF